MEIKVLFEELLPRLADVRQTSPEDRLRSNFIAGTKRLPIEIARASPSMQVERAQSLAAPPVDDTAETRDVPPKAASTTARARS
jgi:hypothetical protein